MTDIGISYNVIRALNPKQAELNLGSNFLGQTFVIRAGSASLTPLITTFLDDLPYLSVVIFEKPKFAFSCPFCVVS